ncbi:Xanthine dehydrogenase [Papilio xuthus]|uniref:Xanthine dehydrogenase n=1 Tax=Papilio xuthus TaxID=66420 RepID=A0A194PIT3_PAPXU|nr:Xanthine dehydrogenase [Papilio xuthus]
MTYVHVAHHCTRSGNMIGGQRASQLVMDRIRFKVNGVECSVGTEVSSDTTLLDYIRGTLRLSGTKYMCREAGCGACIVSVVKSPGATNTSVNAVGVTLGTEVSSDTTLLDYIRGTLRLPGTKYMCREAGCGACIVSVVKSPGATNTSVNACMVSVTFCQDWDVTTIEHLGNKLKGYHVIQKTLAENNGSQCGYCSPGWVMAMHRCTGYRPILQAFKKFATDAPHWNKIYDIEDLQICKKTGDECKTDCEDYEWCVVNKDEVENQKVIHVKLEDGREWFRVLELIDAFNILRVKGDDSYMLVAGNTAKGAYPIFRYPRILIDISMVSELKQVLLDQNLVIGAGSTISEVMEVFLRLSRRDYFEYLLQLYEHLTLVAHIPVRNLGTIAGNLMIKHQHREFPSDIFLLFETVGAQITILHPLGLRKVVTMQDFLKENMRGKIILNVLFPPLKDYKVVTFKVMPRAQNAHAIVNAGFLYKGHNNIVHETRIVYGGLSPTFVRATNTERYLIGKPLFTNETLQSALHVLNSELVVTANPPEASVEYRRQLALSLFYKGLLTLCPENILHQRYRSGAIKLKESRPVSDGRQIFDTNPTLWPIQCSGEAMYAEDIPPLAQEVFASFVLSTVALGDIDLIDSTQALREPGVIAFYTAKDIPGVNSFIPSGALLSPVNEELLCNGKVKYYNQPIAIIVAKTRAIADRAAKLVTVKYKNVKRPLLDIKVAKNETGRNTMFLNIAQTDRGSDAIKVINGSFTIYGQYHFCMETLVCVTKPTEEGLEVHSSTQWMDGVQVATSRALNLPQNKIDVHVRRIGGAYGYKITRSLQVAVACNLVAHHLNRPCRFIQSLTNNMRAVGKRLPCSTNFEVGVNSQGVVQYLNYDLYDDHGYIVNEPFLALTTDIYNNCYNKARWNYRSFNTTTDNPSNTWCRSPGTLECIAMTESIIERISYELSLDPIQVRLANIDPEVQNDMTELSETIIKNSQYTERRSVVDKFNRENRWKKRGLRVAFMKWVPVGSFYLDINMSVYHDDGTVIITHSGIEMGQGINTKAVQICAYFLKIPVEMVQIKANNTIIAPNAFISGGSLTSQYVGIGVQKVCEAFLLKLEPVRNRMTNPTWVELIQSAFAAEVDLQTHAHVNSTDVQKYNIFGATIAEVEVDILTGQTEVLRVDLLEDAGRSVSPEIDIGQVEGAFVMGLGYWTSENLVYNPDTGELLTNRTWEYWVPQARDIPQDLRIYFRKKSYSNDAILGSKATGEPATCMAIVVPFAIREAISSARLECGIPTNQWFDLDGPYTYEKICLSAATNFELFKFY